MLNKYTNTLQIKGDWRLAVSNGCFIKSSDSFPIALMDIPSAASASVVSPEALIIISHLSFLSDLAPRYCWKLW